MAVTTGASESPIFIVGAPRSGTSLMRLLLNAHSHIAVSFETDFFIRLHRDWGAGRDEDWPRAVAEFADACERKFSPAMEMSGVAARLLALEKPDYAALLSEPLRAWAEMLGKGRWAEKSPTHMFYGESIKAFFPGARVIVMQRDPRAVVASLNRAPFAPNDSVINARLWRDGWSQGITSLQAALPPDQIRIVRYEDFVNEPVAHLEAICSLIGEPYEEAMLNFHESAQVFMPKRIPGNNLDQPISPRSLGWHSKLSARELAIVEAVCGPEMEALGYEREATSIPVGVRAEVTAKMRYVDLKQRQNSQEVYHEVSYVPLAKVRRKPKASVAAS